MNISELKATRTKLLIDAQKILISKESNAETRSSAKKMVADADVIDEQIALEERLAKTQDEERSAGRPPRSQPGEGFAADETRSVEKKAFVHYLKTGERNMNVLREQRDLTTGNTGVIVAQDFMGTIIEAQKAWGALTMAVGQKKTRNGEPLKVPLVNDVNQVSAVIGETVQVTEADPAFSGFINNVDFLSTGIIKISLAELEDSYFDLDSWIRNAFGKRIARGLSNLIVTGSTSGNFQSIITTATPAGGTSIAPNYLEYLDFVGLYSKLDPAYVQSSSWVFNSQTRGSILGIIDSFGRPLFVPSVNTDTLDTILGRPVVISQYHPNLTAGTVGAVQLGSLPDGYILRTAGDVAILRLNERYADTGEVGFIGYHRNSGFATDAGTHPILNLTMHA